MPRTQIERSQATTAELTEAAHGLFAERGYAATSIDDIVGAASVTRGALYHHFDSKLEVFRAVFEREEARLAASLIEEASQRPDAWSRLEVGCGAFLRACLKPSVRRIILLDGPAVLGWEAAREIESRHTLVPLRAGLADADAKGLLRSDDVDALAHLLFGALCEGGMVIARADEPEQTLPRVTAEIERLLNGARKTATAA